MPKGLGSLHNITLSSSVPLQAGGAHVNTLVTARRGAHSSTSDGEASSEPVVTGLPFRLPR
jgi:hypothetical protein